MNLLFYNLKVQWEKTCWNIGEPSSKAKYYKFSISEKYCKGNFETDSLLTNLTITVNILFI